MVPGISSTTAGAGEETVLRQLLVWMRQGQRVALVTLVGIEGGSPRPLGAQMAVAEDGRHVGYLSGGCLERAVALEAVAAIRLGASRTVRYGKGSPYLDIALPCGSGLDVLIAVEPLGGLIERAVDLLEKRTAILIAFDLETGRLQLEMPGNCGESAAMRAGSSFRRPYWPALRLLLVGSGPSVAAIATVGRAAGLKVDVATPDDTTRSEVEALALCVRSMPSQRLTGLADADRWCAAVVAFHEHDREGPLLADLLQSDCFYIGALGSRTVHTARVRALESAGLSGAALGRLRGPIGLIEGAKSRSTLAVGVIAEVLAEAKVRGFVD